MRKINWKQINKLMEKQLRQYLFWMNKNLLREFSFILFSIFLISLSVLPYANLFFTRSLVFFLIIILAFLIFRTGWKVILYFCFCLFIISLLLNFIGLLSLSHIIGDYIYGVLVLVAIKFFTSI